MYWTSKKCLRGVTIPDIGMCDRRHRVISLLCTQRRRLAIGSSAVKRYTCSINAFGLKAFLSYMMFYCVKKFKILDTMI